MTTPRTTPRPRVTKRLKRVAIGSRTFMVKFGEAGQVLGIMERRNRAGTVRDHTYWHRTHKLGGPTTLVRRVLNEAGVDTREIAGH